PRPMASRDCLSDQKPGFVEKPGFQGCSVAKPSAIPYIDICVLAQRTGSLRRKDVQDSAAELSPPAQAALDVVFFLLSVGIKRWQVERSPDGSRRIRQESQRFPRTSPYAGAEKPRVFPAAFARQTVPAGKLGT